MGSVESLMNVKRIVEGSARPTVAVVSALSGVTDNLIAASNEAAAGRESYQDIFNRIVERHHTMVNDVISAGAARDRLMGDIDTLLEELNSIYKGVFLIQDLTPKTADAIVAYGERLSSLIVTALIPGAERFDARQFIKTTMVGTKRLVDFDSTNRLVREKLGAFQGIAVVTGFIATDLTTGVTTNLGRGGSDYTAAILAAELGAEELEIWTDVDGFMTADPRLIPTAYTIDALSYGEAMELCNFGAKVVYPPTIYPVCVKNIPIRVKNTFRPDAPGSVIRRDVPPSSRPIRGISSVKETSIVTVAGPTMVGVIGVNRRIFTTLVFLVATAISMAGVVEARGTGLVEWLVLGGNMLVAAIQLSLKIAMFIVGIVARKVGKKYTVKVQTYVNGVVKEHKTKSAVMSKLYGTEVTKDGEQNVEEDAPREEEKEEPKTERFKMEKDKMRAIAARAAEKIKNKSSTDVE